MNRPKEILFVDDQSEHLHLLSTILTQRGYGVRRAASGEMALQLIQHNPPNIILLDINVPGLDGYEVCRRLKTSPETASIPVIFISPVDESVNQAIDPAVGGVDYLPKPFDTSEALARIEQQLALQNPDLQRILCQHQAAEQGIQLALKVSQMIVEAPDWETALQMAVKQITCAIAWEYGEVWLPTDGLLCCCHQWQRSPVDWYRHRVGLTLAPAQGLLGQAWQSGSASWWDGTSDAVELLGPCGQVSQALTMPMRFKQETLAVLAFYQSSPDSRRSQLLQIAKILSNQLGISLYSKHLETALMRDNLKLKQMASRDFLTGLANRGYFDEYLEQEWQRLMRLNLPLGIILADIDFYKNFNDTYGHTAGDRCLQQVAGAIQTCTRRSTDLVARYGGEEFIILLPNTSAIGVNYVAEEIRQAIERLHVPHRKSLIRPHVTISLGATGIVPSPKIEPRRVIHTADRALYTAKQKGRNQVCWLDFSL
jgi:diguanylate cyclase (GGDEF)-like protein